MKIKTLILAVLIVLVSCKKQTDKKESINTDSIALRNQQEFYKDSIKNNETLEIADLRDSETGCIRGQPEPIVDSIIFKNKSFVLSNDNKTGIETIAFENGDTLIIENTGCEYYVLNFNLSTKLYNHENNDIKSWYLSVIDFIEHFKKADNSPVSMGNSISYIKKYLNNESAIEFGHEINCDDSEIRNFFILHSVENSVDQKKIIKFSFNVGPL